VGARHRRHDDPAGGELRRAPRDLVHEGVLHGAGGRGAHPLPRPREPPPARARLHARRRRGRGGAAAAGRRARRRGRPGGGRRAHERALAAPGRRRARHGAARGPVGAALRARWPERDGGAVRERPVTVTVLPFPR
jgi:hypothetical protein